jgi:hypothetical protein
MAAGWLEDAGEDFAGLTDSDLYENLARAV